MSRKIIGIATYVLTWRKMTALRTWSSVSSVILLFILVATGEIYTNQIPMTPPSGSVRDADIYLKDILMIGKNPWVIYLLVCYVLISREVWFSLRLKNGFIKSASIGTTKYGLNQKTSNSSTSLESWTFRDSKPLVIYVRNLTWVAASPVTTKVANKSSTSGAPFKLD